MCVLLVQRIQPALFVTRIVPPLLHVATEIDVQQASADTGVMQDISKASRLQN